MPQFTDCLLLVVSEDPDEPDFRCDDCDVTLESDYLEVVYFDSEGPVVFGGPLGESGAFELVCRSRPRTATLARQGESCAFEGRWEGGESGGSWRVVLPDGALG